MHAPATPPTEKSFHSGTPRAPAEYAVLQAILDAIDALASSGMPAAIYDPFFTTRLAGLSGKAELIAFQDAFGAPIDDDSLQILWIGSDQSLEQIEELFQNDAPARLDAFRALREDYADAFAQFVAVSNGYALDTGGDPGAVGTDGDDLLEGGAGDDLIEGLAGNDTVAAGAGDDTLVGGAGDDILDGGPGSDTAVFAGARQEYTVQRSGQTLTVSGGSDGSDTLSSFEHLQFADQTIGLVPLPTEHPPDYGKDVGFLFDEVYYLLANPDLAGTVTPQDALAHYLGGGAAQGRDPNSWFDPAYYANRWQDLQALNLDDATLFMHYNLFGVWEGRSAGPKFDQFDGNRYLTDWPDVALYVDANVDDFLGSRSNGAIAHFIIYGADEQRLAYDTTGALVDTGYVL